MKKRNIAMGISCVIVYCIALLFIFRGYHQTSSDVLHQLLYENQKIHIQSQQSEIISKVESVRTSLKTMTAVLEECKSEEEMHKFDAVMEQMSYADDIQAQSVQYFSFSGLNTEKMSQDDQQIIEALKKGQSVVSRIHQSSVDYRIYYGIAEPVNINGQYVGFIRGLIVSDTLLGSADAGVFGGDMETFLIHENGDNAMLDYIERDESTNLYELLKTICDKPEDVDEIKEEISQGKSAVVIQTTVKGDNVIISCGSLPYNDWWILNVVYSDKVGSYVQMMTEEGRNTVLTVTGMAAFIMVLFLIAYYYIGKEQRYEKKKTALMANFSDTVLCEYDIKRDHVSCTSNIVEMLPIGKTSVSHFSEYVKGQGLIFPEDREIVRQIITTMPKEGEILNYEVRLKNSTGGYSWYRVDVIALYIKGKKQDKLILKINDITTRKENELGLLEKVQSDALTGLLNRDTFEKMVRTALKEGGGYLYLLDLDNFKQVNDTYGHQMGDDILRKVGECIRHSFRSRDYVARYGGDEFLMFILSPVSEEVAKDRADTLVKDISKLTLENYPEFKMTCSIGMAKSQGEAYEQLLEKTDRAMYEAKRVSKNAWIML